MWQPDGLYTHTNDDLIKRFLLPCLFLYPNSVHLPKYGHLVKEVPSEPEVLICSTICRTITLYKSNSFR